jgi:hypothetical protein
VSGTISDVTVPSPQKCEKTRCPMLNATHHHLSSTSLHYHGRHGIAIVILSPVYGACSCGLPPPVGD